MFQEKDYAEYYLFPLLVQLLSAKVNRQRGKSGNLVFLRWSGGLWLSKWDPARIGLFFILLSHSLCNFSFCFRDVHTYWKATIFFNVAFKNFDRCEIMVRHFMKLSFILLALLNSVSTLFKMKRSFPTSWLQGAMKFPGYTITSTQNWVRTSKKSWD